MFHLDTFNKEYETKKVESVIRGRRYSFLIPSSLEAFINTQDLFHDFPLWAKIWESSLVLADYLARMPPEPEKRFLEIGAGLGLVSIVAASFGHSIMMTDCNPQCLDFAKANARINHCSSLKIMELDWDKPQLEGFFDYIVGAEVIYAERDFRPILELLRAHLKPEGEAILAVGMRKTSMEFLSQTHQFFDITAQKKILRSKGGEIQVILARLTCKD
jgi:predicted nicotinamide N-methyase